MDREDHVLFIRSRSPYTTHDFINILLELPLGIRNAMYVEGGPQAQMYVESGDYEDEWVGSFETGFCDESNERTWSVPNVIGVRRR